MEYIQQQEKKSGKPMTANEIIAKLGEEVGYLKAQQEIAGLKRRIAELEAQVARKS